jgi:hypothetical protein
MNKYAALLGTSMLLVGTANAEGFFVGGSFGAGDASLSTNVQLGEIEDRLYFAKGFGGYRVNDYFAVEGSLLAGTNDDYDDGFDDDVEASFAALSASFVGIIPASDNFELYAKVGGYLGESDVGNNFFLFGSGNNEDESGLVWGAGMFINFGPRNQFTVRVDYENFDTDVFDDLWAVSAGFQYNF